MNIRIFMKFMKNKVQNNGEESGFTLIEVLLYTAIVGSVLLAVASIFSMVIQAREYDQTSSEVNAVGSHMIDRISQEVRNAKAVGSPAQGVTSDRIVLETYTPETTPVVFSVTDGVAFLSEGTGDDIPLSSSRVEISGFEVTAMGEGSDGVVLTYSFTVSHINPDGRSEYDYQRMFMGSAASRLATAGQ
jgi:type II secretory pathway pseudopilin PulG